MQVTVHTENTIRASFGSRQPQSPRRWSLEIETFDGLRGLFALEIRRIRAGRAVWNEAVKDVARVSHERIVIRRLEELLVA